MQITNTILAQHLRGLKDVVELGQKSHPTLWTSFVAKDSTKFKSEIFSTIDEFGYANLANEGATIPVNGLTAPYSMTVTPVLRGLAFVISAQALFTDGYGKLKQAGTSMVRSMMATREYNAANILSLGFTAPGSGGTKTMDNVALFSASHPLASGTDSNIQTSSSLAIATLESGVQIAGTVMSHKGKPSMYAGSFNLIVPDSLEMVARRLATSVEQPGAYNAEKNVVGPRVRVLVNPYLSSSTSWFLAPADTSMTPLQRLTQMPVTETVEKVGNPPSVSHVVYESDTWFANDWRFVVGSTA